MEDAILFGYESIIGLLSFSVALLWCRHAAKKGSGEQKRPVSDRVLIGAFALYLIGLLYVTSPGTLYDLLRFSGINASRINLIPFADEEMDTYAYFLNVILFVPLGLLLPAVWSAWRRMWKAVLVGFGVSLMIECAQLLNYRSTDIDDLILNTLGALIGYGLFRLIFHKRKLRPARGLAAWEPIVCMLAAFLARFFLFDEFGAARLLYHF